MWKREYGGNEEDNAEERGERGGKRRRMRRKEEADKKKSRVGGVDMINRQEQKLGVAITRKRDRDQPCNDELSDDGQYDRQIWRQ